MDENSDPGGGEMEEASHSTQDMDLLSLEDRPGSLQRYI